MKNVLTLTQLNEMIDNSGLSRYEIGKLSGVNQSILSKIKNDPNYDPYLSTVTKIIITIEKYGK